MTEKRKGMTKRRAFPVIILNYAFGQLKLLFLNALHFSLVERVVNQRNDKERHKRRVEQSAYAVQYS